MRRKKRFGFEQLENRRLLAGDVDVFFDPSSGLLEVVGDSKGNDIQITRSGGDVVVTGNDTNVTGDTSVPVADLVDIAIAASHGDDTIDISNLFILPGSLSIDGGNGNDSVKLSTSGGAFVVVRGDLQIDTGNGNDQVELSTSDSGLMGLNGELVVDTGNGDDSIVVQTAGNSSNLFLNGSSATLDTGNGNDDVSLRTGGSSSRIFINEPLTIDTGNGNDQVELATGGTSPSDITVGNPAATISILTGTGNDAVDVSLAGGSLRTRGLTVDTAQGVDEFRLETIGDRNSFFNVGDVNVDLGDLSDVLDWRVDGFLSGVNVTGNLAIDAGNGSDTIVMEAFGRFSDIRARGSFTLLTGAGSDDVRMTTGGLGFSDIDLRNATIDLGSGADDMVLDSSGPGAIFLPNAHLVGGFGYDKLTVFAVNLGSALVEDFEEILP